MILTGIVVFAAWIPADDNAAVMVFSGLYGFTSGAYVSLLPALIAQMSDIVQIGVRVGLTYAVVSLAGLTGNPIAGALVDRQHDGFLGVQLFTGCAVIVGAVFIIAARLCLTEGKLKPFIR